MEEKKREGLLLFLFFCAFFQITTSGNEWRTAFTVSLLFVFTIR